MKKWMYLLGFIVGCALVALFMPWIRRTCSPVTPAATAVTSATVVTPALSSEVPAAASASVKPPASVIVLTPLVDLPVDDTYGRPIPTAVNAYSACAYLKTRVVGHTGNLPYPYMLTVYDGDRTIDCGFFAAIHEGGWRTAFCLDEKGLARNPQRLYIYKDRDSDVITITVGLERLGSFIKAPCP
jgi:hypothetical protein